MNDTCISAALQPLLDMIHCRSNLKNTCIWAAYDIFLCSLPTWLLARKSFAVEVQSLNQSIISAEITKHMHESGLRPIYAWWWPVTNRLIDPNCFLPISKKGSYSTPKASAWSNTGGSNFLALCFEFGADWWCNTWIDAMDAWTEN